MTASPSGFTRYSAHLRIVYSQKMLKSKDILTLEPDMLWQIERGVVRSLSWDEDGRSFTLGFWGIGDVVGYPLSRIRPYQVECLTEVQVTRLSPDSHDLQQALLVHAWKSEELLKIIHRPLVTDRLLQLLQWLASHFGKPVTQGTLLDLRLTHQDLADTIGSTRVSVTRLLQQLEREGRIRRSQRHFILHTYSIPV